MQYVENKTYAELRVGDSASMTRVLRREDIEPFAALSGDATPDHRDADDPAADPLHKVITHGMWGGGLISAVLGAELPGPGTIYVRQTLDFHAPLGLGDAVTVQVTVAEKRDNDHVILDCLCTSATGEVVISGQAEVIAPSRKVRRPRVVPAEAHLHERGLRYRQLIEAAAQFPPVRTAVVHPCDARSLGGAMAARDERLIIPVLIGPQARIRAAAASAGIDLAGVEIVDTPHSHASAAEAVARARSGDVAALMKGALHTDEIMAAVIDAHTGLRTERRISHVYVLDVPHYPKPLFITDAAINIEPDLDVKRDIIQNAIDLAHALGIACPKVAVLSAVETVTPAIRSTIEAAALCKMAERGQITGGLVDGPLAFDNAVSLDAAQAKGIVSQVAGQADILVAPDLVSGNMIAKQLIYLAGAEAAGLALGARVPIILTSRSDGTLSRVASAALAKLFIARSAAKLAKVLA
ncbi:MAG TPA: bifunctional enoyl-CoA hydratase/phosphate acetyltransferase [Acetobacteraceae bacterium]|jgi:phosphotransacetylase/acyl dehydratase|nr:bifunctional enoyl-CoA hydratase/phosphate acetyltransferase [Acetobacteraceae bacterium]